MSITSTFNTQLINFYNELENLNIDKKLINNSKTKIILLKKANSKILIELFIQHIYIYKSYITSKDIQIFNNINENIEDKENNKIYMLFNVLKNNWSIYNDNTKENIWLYLNVLIKLCDNYINK